MLRVFPWFSSLLLFLPVAAGLWFTVQPAFGYFPLLGFDSWHLAPWRELLAVKALLPSIGLSLFAAWGASLLSLLGAFWLAAHCYRSRIWRTLSSFLPPFLAIPHVALAVALLFLFSSSGWVSRLLSPWATGWAYPPSWGLTQDPYGLSLMFSLWIKELPFLLFVILSHLPQLKVQQSLAVASSFGYNQKQVWWRIIIPQLLPRMRLAMFAVLAFSLSVVDVAQVIGPTQPPSFAMLVWQWLSDASFEVRMRGSAGALLILLLVLASLGCYWLLERALARFLLWRGLNGKRKRESGNRSAKALILLVLTVLGLSCIGLVLWSLAWRWRFPEVLPQAWSLRYWAQLPDYALTPLFNTFTLALCASLTALVLTLGCLEYQQRAVQQGRQAWSKLWLVLLYLPLLLPQLAFLYGIQVQLVRFNLDGSWWGMLWIHLIFVLPYVYLSLASAYINYDQRYMSAALSLCHSYWQAYFKVKLPMLLRPLLLAFSIGFAVSVAQYLPTLFVGGGRVETLTTEAVALASGGDRRLSAVVVLLQASLPLMIYLLALFIPKWAYRNRREMQS